MLAAAAGLIVEDDDRCSPLQLIASIGPEISPPGLALARIQLLNRGLIGVQHLAPLEQCAQTLHQGLQGQTQLAHPLGQRGAGNRCPMPFADLLDAIERQMIQIFLDQNPGMQPRSRQTSVDRTGRHGGGGDSFATPTGVLGTDVAMDKESGGLHVQLFADVFANLHQPGTACSARTGGRFVAMLDPRQRRRQRMAASAPGLAPGRTLLFQFRQDGGLVFGAAVQKQLTLLGTEHFTPGAETDPPVMGQLQRQLLDLQLAPLELGLALGQL